MISVAASELIHSTQLVARIRSARLSAVPVSEATLSSMKHSGKTARAAVVTGSTLRRFRSWAGVQTRTRNAAVAVSPDWRIAGTYLAIGGSAALLGGWRFTRRDLQSS